MRAALRSTGFSQNTALPARTARSIRSAWVSVGVQITTASMSFASMIESTVPIAALLAIASRCAAAASASATAARVARGCAATLPP